MKKKLRITIGDRVYEVEIEVKDVREILRSLLSFASKARIVRARQVLKTERVLEKSIKAPISGKVVKVIAKEGQKVNKGDILIVLESMKTHVEITSHTNGVVKRVLVKEGDFVKVNQDVVILD